MPMVNFKLKLPLIAILIALPFMLSSCRQDSLESQPRGTARPLTIMAADTFLQDITKNVAGERAEVESLVPLGMDPHSFQPVPGDLKQLTNSQVVVINGAGLETGLQDILDGIQENTLVINASEGLQPQRTVSSDEIDPHFWFDPILTIRYVENIRDGLSSIDPDRDDIYASNASVYIEELKKLDSWISDQIALIPPENRMLVTNHESFGYFAQRYGFRIVGAILPSVSPGASPSARQLADLARQITQSGAHAIFLETGSNPRLAQQIASETGSQVITDMYTHSLSAPDGPAGSYLDLMRHNVSVIRDALK